MNSPEEQDPNKSETSEKGVSHSEYRDELLNMVHEKRGLPPGTAPPSRPERITHHEIKALKTTTTRTNLPAQTTQTTARLFSRFFGSIAAFFNLFVPKRGPKKKK